MICGRRVFGRSGGAVVAIVHEVGHRLRLVARCQVDEHVGDDVARLAPGDRLPTVERLANGFPAAHVDVVGEPHGVVGEQLCDVGGVAAVDAACVLVQQAFTCPLGDDHVQSVVPVAGHSITLLKVVGWVPDSR